MDKKINVTVWNEAETQEAYPEGIHRAIAGFLTQSGRFNRVRTAILPEPSHGLTDEVLHDTDVLIWWGHCFHHAVSDDIVYKAHQRVLDGMGLLVLHSAHCAKLFGRLMGTNTHKLRWRDVGEMERVWVVEHNHPIMAGSPEYIEVPRSEMYGEAFHIPAPDELLAISWYEGGEVFRSACTFKRGCGRIFYFSPGHEGYPIYRMPEIQRIITNGAVWAAPESYPSVTFDHTPDPLPVRRG